ncbi:protein of unknown function [Pseudomonas sp. JV241A]|nr:protein of unknown function [Pseudomonas sp. JV241A]
MLFLLGYVLGKIGSKQPLLVTESSERLTVGGPLSRIARHFCPELRPSQCRPIAAEPSIPSP